MIYIHTPLNSRYYGVYDDGGWKQADSSNLATHIAVLDEYPIYAGSYSGLVYGDDEEVAITTDEIIEVPYVDGAPVTNSVTGVSKISSHPKGKNNMAWFFIDIPEMDRDDTSLFNATCRSSIWYDSSNPTRWHSSELKAEVLNDYLEDSSIFIANKDTKSQDLLVYEEEGTEAMLTRIDRWINTIGRRGL